MAENDDDDSKTEEATPRRREEARDRGQTPLSHEAVAAASLAGASATLVVLGGALATGLASGLVTALESLPSASGTALDARDAAAQALSITRVGALPALAIVATIVAFTLLAAYSQIGFKLSPKAIQFDPARVDPSKGFSGFSALVRGCAPALPWRRPGSRRPRRASWRGLTSTNSRASTRSRSARHSWRSVTSCCALRSRQSRHSSPWRSSISCTNAGNTDAICALSPREIRDELRQSEGDPHVRARVRALQREIGRRRMMAEVPKATVVITNPTHFAVALRYESDAGSEGAPLVVAKGVDEVARRIKEVAAVHGIPQYEDVPLARALHAGVEIGERIPEGLYRAVAGVLAWVYRTHPPTAKAGDRR